MAQPQTFRFEVLERSDGIRSLYCDDHRISGRETKPLGGGSVVASWTIEAPDLFDAIGLSARARGEATGAQ